MFKLHKNAKKNFWDRFGTVKIVQKYKSIKVQKFNGKLSPVITNTLAAEIPCAVPVRPMRFTLFFAVKKIKNKNIMENYRDKTQYISGRNVKD